MTRRSARGACLLLCAIAALGLSGPHVLATTNAARSTPWSLAKNGTHGLLDVAAPWRSRAWAVGTRENTREGAFQAIGKVWDGSSWRSDRVVDPYNSELFDLDAGRSSGAWAVGDENYHPLVERRRHGQWRQVKSPPVGAQGGILFSVSMVGANDGWAVGWTLDADAHPKGSLVERWDGRRWSIIDAPSSPLTRPTDVAAFSRRSAWVLLDAQRQVLRWDGKTWSLAGQPSLWPQGIDGSSPDDVWMVGSAVSDGQPGAAHWDGTSWSKMDVPPVGEPDSLLYSVSVRSADDVWAVGYTGYPPQGQQSQTLIVHWDGTAWQRVPSPSPGSQLNILRSVSAHAADDVWAVGVYSNKLDLHGRKLLYLHWNGSTWSQVVR